jgi:hypothetical protein
VVVLHGHVCSIEAVLQFGCERGLGCDGEKGSNWSLEEDMSWCWPMTVGKGRRIS